MGPLKGYTGFSRDTEGLHRFGGALAGGGELRVL